MPNNKILTATNTAFKVTNLAAAGGSGQASGTQTLEGVPIGTPSDSATGELAVKVRIVAGGTPPPSGGTFGTVIALATTSGTIPAPVLGWSVTAVSGTVTVGGASVPVGASVGGGGYAGYVSANDLAYTISAGSALIVYETPG